MSTNLIESDGLWKRVEAFVGASLSGSVTVSQLAEFEQLLCETPEARDLYVELVEMSVLLPHAVVRVKARPENDTSAKRDGRESLDDFSSSGDASLFVVDPNASSDALPSPAPSFAFGGVCHHTITYFSQIGPLSYLTAAVLLGIGILLGSFIRIQTHHSGHFVERFGPLPPGSTFSPNEAMAVGHITALADCQGRQWSVASGQWSEITNHKLEIINHKFSLGDRFVLSSGLMEIAYNTGAKVILEGPCTYEVDSDRGGFLAVGRLTARIVASGQWPVAGKTNQQKHESESLTTGHGPLATALFAVRTPTATVTDLGTEFGVEVQESGTTRSYVFQGSVAVRERSRGSKSSEAPLSILHAGESASVRRGRNSKVVVTHEHGWAEQFVRRIDRGQRAPRNGEGVDQTANHPSHPIKHQPSVSPEAYARYVLSLKPSAYYRMERQKQRQGRIVVLDSAPGAHHGVFHSRDTSVSPFVPGQFGDSLAFRGESTGDCVIVQDYPGIRGKQLTVAAWVMAAAHPREATIAANWIVDQEGTPLLSQFHFGLSPWGGALSSLVREQGGSSFIPEFLRIADGMKSGVSPLPLNRWQHVAFVVDGGDGDLLRLYRNGKQVASRKCNGLVRNPPGVVLGIGAVNPTGAPDAFSQLCWQGRIDELAIFSEALSPRTIERLYLGRTTAAKNDGAKNDP